MLEGTQDIMKDIIAGKSYFTTCNAIFFNILHSLIFMTYEEGLRSNYDGSSIMYNFYHQHNFYFSCWYCTTS